MLNRAISFHINPYERNETNAFCKRYTHVFEQGNSFVSQWKDY